MASGCQLIFKNAFFKELSLLLLIWGKLCRKQYIILIGYMSISCKSIICISHQTIKFHITKSDGIAVFSQFLTYTKSPALGPEVHQEFKAPISTTAEIIHSLNVLFREKSDTIV